jgi:Fe-S cluster assembly ATP-binding protein
MNQNLLKISELEIETQGKQILNKLNLSICKKEVHVIMGPNGSGKSTLSKVLAGHPSYIIKSGEITFLSKNIIDISPENRSHEGIFLAFQYPIEISGITNYDFLRIAYNQKRKYLGQSELDPLSFLEKIQKFLKILDIKEEFLSRNVNEGFSGGEKKKNEILQILVLEPKLVILDEIDSGLDIDALKIICEVLKNYLPEESSLLIITHSSKMLDYIHPDFVHILLNGKIERTGNIELVKTLEVKGYKAF